MGDFGQDFLSALTGGQTSEEEDIQRRIIDAINRGYGTAASYEQDKYLGATGDKVKELQDTKAALEYMSQKSMGRPGDIEAMQRAQAKIAQLEGEIQQGTSTTAGTQLKPDWYTPTTSYDVPRYKAGAYGVEKYSPEKDTAQSESLWYKLDPERFAAADYEAAAMQDPSMAALARADTGGLAAQREALAGMQDIYQQGGLTAIDRARLEESRRRNQMIERASREAILADMERRGQSGSGVELASRLANQQGSAERQAQEALGTEALAQERSERALGAASGMGQQLAEDVFRRAYTTGSAADEINRFNTQGVRDVQAATRAAQDASTQWQRDMLGRDVDRLANVQRYNTMTANDAAMWNALQQNAANQWNVNAANQAGMFNTGNQLAQNQWGAQARNQAGMYNTANQTAANQFNVQNALNQLYGYNTQQGNLGNLALQNQLALAGVYSQQPTADWGQFANNLWNIQQAIGNEVQKGMTYGMGGQGGVVSNMMPGGGGTQSTMNPIVTR